MFGWRVSPFRDMRGHWLKNEQGGCQPMWPDLVHRTVRQSRDNLSA